MAKKETYDRLFSDVADVAKSEIHDKDVANAVAKIILRSKPAILRGYHRINGYVRAEYMKDGVEKLDRHKCGACFMIAFEKHLIFIDDNKKYEAFREKIAIVAAMTVLVNFAEDEARKQGDFAMIAHLDANDGFVMPKSTQDKKPYDKIWAMELCRLRRINTNKQEAVSALSVAKDLFGIEAYNRLLTKIRGLSDTGVQ